MYDRDLVDYCQTKTVQDLRERVRKTIGAGDGREQVIILAPSCHLLMLRFKYIIFKLKIKKKSKCNGFPGSPRQWEMRGTRNGRGGFGSKRKTDFLWKEHGDHFDGNDDDDGKNMVIIAMVKLVMMSL